MRSLTIALISGLLAAGSAYAYGLNAEADTQRAAGTLTCTTNPDATLVFGRTPVASCTFAAEHGGSQQDYVALFSGPASLAELETAQTIKWRVMTKDGAAHPGMLSDLFQAPRSKSEGQGAAHDLVGRMASLQLLSHSGQKTARFALAQPRIRLAASQP